MNDSKAAAGILGAALDYFMRKSFVAAAVLL
jgi:hypothetical protein